MNADSATEDARREAAADWLLRLRSADMKTQDIAAWMAWCDADSANRRTFMELQRLWRQSTALPERTVTQAELDADTYTAQVPVREWRAASHRASRRGAGKILALAAAVSALAVGGLLAIDLVRTPADAIDVNAPTGRDRELALADRSRVTLAAGSQLSTRFGPQARHVFLNHGEAFFKVAKDSRRPFVVHAPGATITALGTSFNVRAEEGVVRVAVTEGLVDVERGGTSAKLPAGQQMTVMPNRTQSAVAPVEAAQATAWMDGTLRFVDEPLFSVVAAVNRYAAKPVIFAARDLGELHYTGTVMVGSIDEWLRGLPDSFPMTVDRQDHAVVLNRAPAR